jgi:CRISPR/Cas system Type II protein with McrA/HNH and RuvC-like nuclease domain
VQVTVSATDVRRKYESQSGRCAYTGDELTPDNITADHIVPVSSGGSHDLDNVALVIDQVNAMKGTLSLDEYVELCRKVVAHADSHLPAFTQ